MSVATMTAFQPGDRVVRTGPSNKQVQTGQTFVVRDVYPEMGSITTDAFPSTRMLAHHFQLEEFPQLPHAVVRADVKATGRTQVFHRLANRQWLGDDGRAYWQSALWNVEVLFEGVSE